MKTLSENIGFAENIWLKESYLFLKESFTKKNLPSHDHQHHLRVWLNAKYLLHQLHKQGVIINYSFIEALLISSLFHDSGMLKNYDHEHGFAGRNICENFLRNNENKPDKVEEILDAIEKHDNKLYNNPGALISDRIPNLLTALNISDDLDALGTIGIYRYSEIYLMRGIPLDNIGLKIMDNLSGRFNNFLSNCSNLPEILWIHKPRYNQVEEFFSQYNRQFQQLESGRENRKSGPYSVIKTIQQQALKPEGDMLQICKKVLSVEADMYIQKFFIQLRTELREQNIDI